MNEIPNQTALRAHMGPISPTAERKVLPRLDRHCRHFIALSPLLVVATADASGRVDASPRGDPPGFVRVLDDETMLIPDRPGNNRVDTFANVLSAPGIGLIFFVPGVDETLRINGAARLSTEADALEPSAIRGKTPRIGLVVAIHEVFFHCGKALKRARLWDPAAAIERSEFPTLGRILADQTAEFTVAEADARIETAYRERLY